LLDDYLAFVGARARVNTWLVLQSQFHQGLPLIAERS
jgi:hypothetical protein